MRLQLPKKSQSATRTISSVFARTIALSHVVKVKTKTGNTIKVKITELVIEKIEAGKPCVLKAKVKLL